MYTRWNNVSLIGNAHPVKATNQIELFKMLTRYLLSLSLSLIATLVAYNNYYYSREKSAFSAYIVCIYTLIVFINVRDI